MPGGRVHPGHDVDDADRHLHRLPVGLAGQRHDAAPRLGEQVVAGPSRVGAGLAETADRAVHQPREALPERLVVQPRSSQVTDLEVLDQHIRALQQRQDRLPSRLGMQVDLRRALVAVRGEVIAALGDGAVRPVGNGRAPLPAVVAVPRPFDLDHVGPEIAQQLRAIGAGQDPGHVQDADSRQRRLSHRRGPSYLVRIRYSSLRPPGL